ncbi:membrane protein [Sphaerisporangium siamense]|uniref:Putative cobalt transporter CbtA n=1 Tax=Sphaerisporangium siamense TaxID=795645 RepID=A0A7W7G8I8_9ACTN|nr:CbtA family protein [Sphaerisporangium siamense]MBB4699535.1 putative cobalt transporter CbtA [Sphaerisporangium siamense]GII86949.1 membrane protein [Sphaerisporangium siamense]
MTMGPLLVRGMLAGLVAAALDLVFAWIIGEPQVNLAIAFEARQSAAAGMAEEPELISRTVQQTFGLAVAVGLFGVAVGGLFAVAFAVAFGRLGAFGPRATAALLAGGGFVAVALVPFLKYPANPPAVGSHDTVATRTGLYFALVAIAIAVAIVSVQVGRHLAARLGNWNAALAAGAISLLVIIVSYLILPKVDEVSANFPATVLWEFRLASLGVQAVIWTTLGLVFGVLTERFLASRTRAAQVTAPAA